MAWKVVHSSSIFHMIAIPKMKYLNYWCFQSSPKLADTMRETYIVQFIANRQQNLRKVYANNLTLCCCSHKSVVAGRFYRCLSRILTIQSNNGKLKLFSNFKLQTSTLASLYDMKRLNQGLIVLWFNDHFGTYETIHYNNLVDRATCCTLEVYAPPNEPLSAVYSVLEHAIYTM